MTINIEKDYVIRLEDENKKLKEQNKTSYKPHEVFKLKQENKKLKQQIDNFYYEQSKLKETDLYIKVLKNQLFNAYLIQQHQEREISELKEALSSYNNFVDFMFPD